MSENTPDMAEVESEDQQDSPSLVLPANPDAETGQEIAQAARSAEPTSTLLEVEAEPSARVVPAAREPTEAGEGVVSPPAPAIEAAPGLDGVETPLPGVQAEPVSIVVLAAPQTPEAPGDKTISSPPLSAAGKLAPARNVQPGLVTRRQAFGMAAASSVLTFFLAVFAVLAFLYLVNGDLRYTSPSQLYAVQSRLDAVDRQAETLQTSLDDINTRLDQQAESLQTSLDDINTRLDQQARSLQTSLDQVKGLGARVDTVQGDLDRLQKDLAGFGAQVSGFQDQIDKLSLQVDALLKRTDNFQKFLDGLENLIKTLNQPEAP